VARFFDDASSQYLERASAPVDAAPLTIAAWCYVDDSSAIHGIISLNSGVLTESFFIVSRTDRKLRAYTYTAAGGYSAETTTTFTDNTWFHACGVFAASDSRAAYINGGGKGTNATNVVPAGINTTTVGDAGSGTIYFSGAIAEAAIWNVALTDDEVAMLAKGFSPLFIRPQNLVAYWPLVRADQDVVGGYDLTPVNSPTIAAHPPQILRPAPVLGTFYAAAAEMDIVWGHDTDVLEVVIHDFDGNWTGTGAVENPGVADTERLALEAGEYMVSEVVHTGTVSIVIAYNVYAAGDTINLDYRHGNTPANCELAEWNDYSAAFESLGYVQVRVTSTL